MVDLKKEIKLSDLVRRPNKGKSKAVAMPPGGASARSAKAKKKQEIVGIKIGASQIAAALVVNNGSTPRLTQLARQPLEPGVVVAGEVRDVAALSQALERFFTENKLPRRGIRLGIGTNRIGVRSLDVEGIDDVRQLGNAVRFRAHEALAIPMDEAVLDYHVTGETVTESGGLSRRVLLAAAYREPIDHYVAAFQSARLELVGIDVEAFALLRAVAPARAVDPDAAPSAVVAVALGHDRSTLAISDGTVCDFMRVLEWGGGKLDAAISRALGLTLEEAVDVKTQISFEPSALEPVDGEEPRLVRARTAVLGELEILARELVASLQFYQSEPGSLPIAEILVTGGTSQFPGLAETLERLIRARVRVADPLAGVRAESGAASREDLASFAIAIGLGVEQ
jgi:type IV pilus assembly protein PilM